MSSAAAAWVSGRSASYLLRQLYAFKAGTGSSVAALSMAPVLAQLTAAQMIAVAASAASLEP